MGKNKRVRKMQGSVHFWSTVNDDDDIVHIQPSEFK